jgi:HAD superfamily hydrolase (TIGR01509 family)
VRVSEYAAVLWDLDGTIVDTEPMWIAAEHELAAEHGAVWTDQDAMELIGSSLIGSGEYIRRRLGLTMSAEEVVDYLVGRLGAALERGVPWRPGAHELISELDALGVPQGLVTMSYVATAGPIAATLPFRVVVTGDAVTHAKPHPEPYLLAAERLGVDPARCLAIEDSPTGAASANAAGCHVVVVPHMVPVPEQERRRSLDTLAGVDAGVLLSVFASASGGP